MLQRRVRAGQDSGHHMTTKLHINLSQGVIDVEGDPELVREIYQDLKAHLQNSAGSISDGGQSGGETPTDDPPAGKFKTRRRSATRKKAGDGSENSGQTVIADSPKLDKNLDTSGLLAFYGRYETKNNSEKILVFLKFLTDELHVASPNTDQFYTCYERVDERVPKAFSQAFRDASGRKFGYIDYNSPTDIQMTTVGNNYFKFDLKKKAAE